MRHIHRAALLLGLLLIVAFVVPRIAPIPASIVNFGFHKTSTANNEREWAALPVSYAESTTCQTCHTNQFSVWKASNHKTVNCENCHGPAAPHLEGLAKPIIDRGRDLCGTCHARLAARPVDFPQVDMDKMGGAAPCAECHNPHDPRSNMPPKVPHSVEGRTDCQTCHAPPEAITHLPPQVPHSLQGRSNCLTCHGPDAPKRAITPPIVPHSLEGRSNCLLCHNSGGIKPFPVNHAERQPETCLSCHESKLPAATAPARDTPVTVGGGIPLIPHSLEGRADCVVCHGSGGFKPFPANHAGRTSETCQACHRSS